MPSRGRHADRAEHRHAAQTGIRTHCPEAAQATGIPPQPTGSVSRNLKTPITGPATRHRWAQGQQRLQNELSGHAYGSPQAAEDRALIGKEAVHAVGGLPMTVFRLEPHSHMNVSDDEHVVLDFDLAERFGYQPVARCIDLTRLQRFPSVNPRPPPQYNPRLWREAEPLGELYNALQLRRARRRSRAAIPWADTLCESDPSPFDSNFGTIDDFRHLTYFTRPIPYSRRGLALRHRRRVDRGRSGSAALSIRNCSVPLRATSKVGRSPATVKPNEMLIL